MEELRKQWVNFRNGGNIPHSLWNHFYSRVCDTAEREVSPEEFNTSMQFLVNNMRDLFCERWDREFHVHILLTKNGKEVLCL